jgi:transcriptional regulator GlxA family with amidase domain
MDTLGALLFEGFELLDVFGALEAFGQLAPSGKCRIIIVAERAGAVPRAQGPQAIADYDFANCPKIQILLVPGGFGTRREASNPKLIDFLRRRSAQADLVMSVSTGAGLLARAWLLDGRRATTNKQVFEWPLSQGPRVNWVRQARLVEDGTFVTSSGISARIDMALAVIGQRFGSDTAQAIAIAMEYEWRRDPDRDPFA